MLSNAELAQILSATAQLLTLKKENPFKVKAYRRGAEAVLNHPHSINDLIRKGEPLTKIPGIGQGLAAVIEEAVKTGSSNKLGKLKKDIDPTLLELTDYPGLDIDRTLKLYKRLKINNVQELKLKIESGELEKIAGSRINSKIQAALFGRSEMLLYDAIDLADSLLALVLKQPGVKKAEIAGSIRRRKETVSSIRILTIAKSADSLIKAAKKFGPVSDIREANSQEAVFSLHNGLTLVLKFSSERGWGSDLIELTGSQEHIKKLTPLLKRKNYTSEESAYAEAGLSWIPPELREDRGEIEAARKNKLPVLVELSDILGDLHVHSTFSDGSASIAQMADAARKKGYHYISINDHSQSLKIAGGVLPEDLKEQWNEIDAYNKGHPDFIVLKSSEVDILAEGDLDYKNSVLKKMDLRVCSIHSRFRFDKKTQTARVLTAMKNPYFNIMGHATGRLLLGRKGYDLDFKKIFSAAKRYNVFFEINSSPDRLDLSDGRAKEAKETGIKIAISTDAHSVRELSFMQFGIFQARRGWLTREDVLNTRSWKELRKLIKR